MHFGIGMRITPSCHQQARHSPRPAWIELASSMQISAILPLKPHTPDFPKQKKVSREPQILGQPAQVFLVLQLSKLRPREMKSHTQGCLTLLGSLTLLRCTFKQYPDSSIKIQCHTQPCFSLDCFDRGRKETLKPQKN